MKLTITNRNTAKLTFARESTKKAIAIAKILRDSKNVKLGETDRKAFIEFNFNMSEEEFKSLYQAAIRTFRSLDESEYKFELKNKNTLEYNVLMTKNHKACQCQVFRLKTDVYRLIVSNKLVKCFKNIYDLNEFVNANWDSLEDMQPMSEKEVAEYNLVANQFEMYIGEDGCILPMEHARCFYGYTYEYKEEIKKTGIFKFNGCHKQWENPNFEYPKEYAGFEIETYNDPQLGTYYNYYEKCDFNLDEETEEVEEAETPENNKPEAHHIVTPSTPSGQSKMTQNQGDYTVEIPATASVFRHGYSQPKVYDMDAHHTINKDDINVREHLTGKIVTTKKGDYAEVDLTLKQMSDLGYTLIDENNEGTHAIFSKNFIGYAVPVTKVIENITTPPKALTPAETIMQYHKDKKFEESPISDYETLYMEFGPIREAEAERFKDLLPTIYMLYTDDDILKPIYTGHAGDYDFADLEVFAEQEKDLSYEYILSEKWELKANGDLWLGDELIFNKL